MFYSSLVQRGIYAYSGKALEKRALKVRQLLRDLPYEEVVVVSHMDFLGYVTETHDSWNNAEVRAYRFAHPDETGADDPARLVLMTIEEVKGGKAPSSTQIK